MATVPSTKGKAAPKPAESKPEYKIWELKVPFHCEIGCKHDVERILKKIEGVHTVLIDKQKKVTVVGKVDLETLKEELKKKLRKHAELWNQEKQEKGMSEEVKAKVNQGVTSPAGSQPLVSESEGGAEKSDRGSGRKKKVKEEHKGNSTNNAVEVQGRSSQEGSAHSWYTPPVSFPSSTSPHSWYTPPISFLSSPWSRSTSSSGSNTVNYQPESPSHVSPAEGAGLIPFLKDKSVDELQKLLSDKDAFDQFLLSVDQVKTLKRDQLCKEILQLQISNLEKEAQVMELRNLCLITWARELAAAQEKLNELEKQKEYIMTFCSPASKANNKTDEESEALHRQVLDGKIDQKTFISKY